MRQAIIGVGAFLVGAYMQKKFDVCGKLENLWVEAQESLKSEDTPVENKE
jgi:hypothetical protein